MSLFNEVFLLQFGSFTKAFVTLSILHNPINAVFLNSAACLKKKKWHQMLSIKESDKPTSLSEGLVSSGLNSAEELSPLHTDTHTHTHLLIIQLNAQIHNHNKLSSFPA